MLFCFIFFFHFRLFTLHFAPCATKDTWPGFQELHFANFGTFWLRRRPYLLTLLSWLERPNSSNSFAPTTGKFGRNSLLRTIFKFLRLLSSTGWRNTQWWPQHQPLVSREFCFSQILFNIFKNKDSLKDWVLHSEIIATKITFSWGIRNSLQEIPSAGHAAEN